MPVYTIYDQAKAEIIRKRFPDKSLIPPESFPPQIKSELPDGRRAYFAVGLSDAEKDLLDAEYSKLLRRTKSAGGLLNDQNLPRHSRHIL